MDVALSVAMTVALLVFGPPAPQASRNWCVVGQKVMIPDGREGPVTSLSGDLCQVLVYGQKHASAWDHSQLEPVHPRYGR